MFQNATHPAIRQYGEKYVNRTSILEIRSDLNMVIERYVLL